MNAPLPAGIESYLSDAGFSATEMLVLRKLLEEESLTIRELASKTGKSTGVLDQAMKKLLTKKIAVKGTINGQPRYSIHSLETIVSWVKQDMQERKKNLERRHENFESFISSLKIDRSRPDIEHFQGPEGIRQAYLRLLDENTELLALIPVTTTIEDDPFRDLRVDLFRKRQVRKIFQRVIAPDTPLGRRFQSRDPFEYRKTLLLPESELPVTFEKIITPTIVACFNLQNETACFLKYPDLAASERTAFDTLWNRLQNPDNPAPTTSTPVHTPVPLKTRLLSSFREFILGPRSIAALALFALTAAVLTFGLYKSNRDFNLQRIRDKVTAIASTAALQFDAKDVQAIHTKDDITKPEYAKLVFSLNLVRRSDPQIHYAYLMRRTDASPILHFVADADSLRPTDKKDLNNDGILDAADALSYPGDEYNASESPKFFEGFSHPTSDEEPTTDQWGTFISGYAPIKDRQGRTEAVLGFDFLASELDDLSAETFSPLFIFTAIFLTFLFGRFFALNRSLLHECFVTAKKNKRIVLTRFAFVAMIAGVLYYAYLHYAHQQMISETGRRLMSIAATSVKDFSGKDLDQLHFARDMQKPAYQRIFQALVDIRNKNPELTYSYILRPTEDPLIFEYIADSDSNYNLPHYLPTGIADLPQNFDLSNEGSWPGQLYSVSPPVFNKGLYRPAYGYIAADQWGEAITGMAPIYDDGKLVGILCLDVNLDTDVGYN